MAWKCAPSVPGPLYSHAGSVHLFRQELTLQSATTLSLTDFHPAQEKACMPCVPCALIERGGGGGTVLPKESSRHAGEYFCPEEKCSHRAEEYLRPEEECSRRVGKCFAPCASSDMFSAMQLRTVTRQRPVESPLKALQMLNRQSTVQSTQYVEIVRKRLTPFSQNQLPV